jgi:quercetin dioxygenase-like cupin family protein
MFATVCLALLVGTPALAQQSSGHTILAADAIAWVEAPASLPPGAKSALLYGDPSKPDLFVLRIWFPKGYKLAPHIHPRDEVVTVISGQFLMGYGEKADGKQTHRLTPGTFLMTSANTAHYALFEEDTVLQLNTTGPWGLTYIDPKDDPRNAGR